MPGDLIMYLNRTLLARLERAYGCPVTARAEAVFTPREFGLLEYCARKQRAHDVTLLIPDRLDLRECRFAVIRKPSYPAGVFRPPSGGVEPGEPFEAGAEREGREETGLALRLRRYLARVESRFVLAGEPGRIAPWTTHLFLAEVAGACPERLEPIDRKEIAEARWAGAAELRGPLREAMLGIGSAGMRYRVDLQDLALAVLELAPFAEEPGRVLRQVEMYRG